MMIAMITRRLAIVIALAFLAAPAVGGDDLPTTGYWAMFDDGQTSRGMRWSLT